MQKKYKAHDLMEVIFHTLLYGLLDFQVLTASSLHNS